MPYLFLPPFLTLMGRPSDGWSQIVLGSDGVLRAIATSPDKVINAWPLTPDQIKAHLYKLGPSVGYRRLFENVDGTSVTSHDDLYNPAPDVMIPPQDEAILNMAKALTRKYMEAICKIEDLENPTPIEIKELRNQIPQIWLDGQVDTESNTFDSQQKAEDWNLWCKDVHDFLLRNHDNHWDGLGCAKNSL